ncbi:MAG: GIY-YIG nuclease family protein [Fuerstiella sp.]|nr:GIY-YIG nuclease family protein [Fuerstiella sp.]
MNALPTKRDEGCAAGAPAETEFDRRSLTMPVNPVVTPPLPTPVPSPSQTMPGCPVETPPLTPVSVSKLPAQPPSLSRRLFDILNEAVATAFKKTHEGWAVDRVLADPQLQSAFYEECTRLGLPLSQHDACLRLLKLRKKGGALKGSRRYSVSGEECEPYLYASEIAWATIRQEYPHLSLEEILSNPVHAAELDVLADQFAPGFTSLDYRWGALRLRKSVKKARERGKTLNPPRRFWLGAPFDELRCEDVPAVRGVYLVYQKDECLYVSGADNLRNRVKQIIKKPLGRWGASHRWLGIKYFSTPENETDLLAWVSAVVSQQRTIPQFNVHELSEHFA